MLFYKKYLKYKQKYLLKKQYGGVLSDEITSIIPYIQELEKYKITLEPVLTSNLSRLILDVKQFYRLKLSEIAQQRVLIQQTKHDNDCNEIPDIIIEMLWIGFYKCICDTITNYHESIMSDMDDSRMQRDKDIEIKLQAIHRLLEHQWNYYLPPLIDDIFIYDSHLTKEMLYSTKFAKANHLESQVKPPLYGYVNEPYLKTIIYYSYENYVDVYNEYITPDDGFMEINKIAEKINYAGNHCIQKIYGHDAEVSYDIPKLLNDKYENVTYRTLLQIFPHKIFVNLAPKLKHSYGRNYIHVSISTLYS